MHEPKQAQSNEPNRGRAAQPRPAARAVPGPGLGTQRSTTPGGISAAQILALQKAAGNRAVLRMMASGGAPSGLIQRRLWDNQPARFQTENDLGADNSEYLVTTGGYRRFAPVNILRGLRDQVYYNSANRSFLYLIGMPDDPNDPSYDALYEDPEVQSVAGGSVTMASGSEPDAAPVVADIGPSEGAVVYDVSVDGAGNVGPDVHVGHTVANLNKPLPTLDDPEKLKDTLTKIEKGGLTQETAKAERQQKAINKNPYI